MGSQLNRWLFGLGLGSILLLASGCFLVPCTVADSSACQAAEKSDLLDPNTATAEQLKVHLRPRGIPSNAECVRLLRSSVRPEDSHANPLPSAAHEPSCGLEAFDAARLVEPTSSDSTGRSVPGQ